MITENVHRQLRKFVAKSGNFAVQNLQDACSLIEFMDNFVALEGDRGRKLEIDYHH